MDLRRLLNLDVTRGIASAATSIIDRALHGVSSRLQAGGIER